jgi:glycosyltransferase involved in cell wall biosynthesis
MNVRYSIVVPLYEEEEVLPKLYERLAPVLDGLDGPAEVIFVIDGGRDRSFEIVRELRSRDERVKGIKFSRNFGHQYALSAGIDHARGEAVIMMDGDLQHPPELIPKLVEAWRGGAQIVNTYRESTEGIGPLKRLTAAIFYGLLNRFGNIKLSPNSADFRLIDRRVAERFRDVREQARFLRGLFVWVGFRQVTVPYKAEARPAGRSKYSVGKMARLALDGITSFSVAPLRVATVLGFIISVLGFAYAIYALVVKLTGHAGLTGWTSLIIVVLILGGVQLITLGIIGEYIAKIYLEAKGRPLYIVDETVGIED